MISKAKTMEIKTTCHVCGVDSFVYVCGRDYFKWKSGELIQKAMPYLTDDQRESLMTGYCSTCWDTYLGERDRRD